MRSREVSSGKPRIFVVVLEPGDEAVSCLTRFAREHSLGAASLAGIGAFSKVVLGFFDFAEKDYRRIPLDQQVEVVSLLGDIALGPDGETSLHAHAVVSRSDAAAFGGHLLEGHVHPTLEVTITEAPAHLARYKDATTGLALIKP